MEIKFITKISTDNVDGIGKEIESDKDWNIGCWVDTEEENLTIVTQTDDKNKNAVIWQEMTYHDACLFAETILSLIKHRKLQKEND